MKVVKRILSGLLVLIMAMALFPMADTTAADPVDTTTVDAPDEVNDGSTADAITDAETMSNTRAAGAFLYDQLMDEELQKKVAISQVDIPESCVLCSLAMLLRRAEIINGVDYNTWSKAVTLDWIYKKNGKNVSVQWRKVEKVKPSDYEYRIKQIQVTQQPLNKWKTLLDSHPEGVLVWCRKKDKNGNIINSHGVLLTHYVGDTFYCLDPAGDYWDKGMIKLENSVMGKRYGTTSKGILESGFCTLYAVITKGINYHQHEWNSIGYCDGCEKYYSDVYSYTIEAVSGYVQTSPSGSKWLEVNQQPYAAYTSGGVCTTSRSLPVTGRIKNHYGNTWYKVRYGFDDKGNALYGWVYEGSVDTSGVKTVITINPTSDVANLSKNLTEGNSNVYVRGTVLKSSVTNLSKYTMYIYSWEEDDILFVVPNDGLSGKSYTITAAECNKMKFSKLKAGQYTFYIEMWDVEGTCSWQEWDFYVQKKVVPKYTIDFDANEGMNAPSSQTVSHGTTIYFNALSKPQRDQYNFIGWALNYDAEAPDFLPYGSFTPSSSTVLYAVWEPIEPPAATNLTAITNHVGAGKELTVSWWASSRARSYTVTFYDEAGNVCYEAKTPATTLTTILNEAGNYTVRVKASNVSGDSEYSSAATIIVHAPSVVTFLNYDGSTYTTQTVAYGDDAVSPGTPDREGYTFEGWSGSLTNVVSDRTVSALYEPIEYTVTFLDYNGEIAQESIVCYDGDTPGCAIPPDESLLKLPTGYTLAGWDTDAYLAVTQDVVCTPCAVWANKDIPITATVDEVTVVQRNGVIYGYWVTYSMTNHTETGRNGRAVIALKSAFGKFLTKTESNAFYIDGESSLNFRLYVPISTDIRGENFASTEVYIVDAYSSMIPLSQIAVKTMGTGELDWTDWGTPEEMAHLIQGDSIVQTKTQYRTKTLQFSEWTTSTSYLDWELYQTSTQKSEWSAWSAWQDAEIVASENVDVETRQAEATAAYTQYRYGRYKSTNCSKGTWYHSNDISAKSRYGGTWYLNYTNWSTTRHGTSSTWAVYTTKNNTIGNGIYSNRSGNWRYWWHKYTVSNSTYYWEESRQIPATYKTQYRYRTREDIPIYQYAAWTDWSEWDDMETIASDTLQVETRELIRVKLEQPEDEAVTISGVVTGLENVEGRQAILTIYKVDEASDYSNEYIAQTTLGADGSYSFSNVRTLEMPSAKTGDFTVSLTIEGATSPLFIDTGDLYKAPTPIYSVTFVDELTGAQIGETQYVNEGGSIVAPEVALKEGYTFIGWEYGLTNIRDNMTIKARFAPKSFTVVYVDWENASVAMQTDLTYGSAIDTPTPEDREGFNFIGWKDADGNTVGSVTKSLILYAQYEKKVYTVQFLDEEGNIVSEQQVSHGDAATAPELNLAEGTYLESWSDDSYLSVTGPLVLTPIILYDEDTETAEINISDGIYEGSQTIALSCEDSDAEIVCKIYYFPESEVVGSEGTGDIINSDGEEQDEVDAEFVYTEPFVISETAILEVTCNSENKNPMTTTHEFVIVPEGTIPATPRNISATANSEMITVTWDAVEGADGYMVYRTDQYGQESSMFSASNVYLDDNVSSVAPYWYAVRAIKQYEYAGSIWIESAELSQEVMQVFFGEYAPVSEIVVDVNDTVLLGDSVQVAAIIAPDNAYDNTVEWDVVAGTGEAVISTDGILTATKEGTVTIVATANDGSGTVGSRNIIIVPPSEQNSSLWVEARAVVKGATSHVTVNLSEGTGASMMQFVVRYDPSVLKVEDCRGGELLENLAPTINTAIDGEISFAWDGVGGINDGGVVLDLYFSVVDTAITQETLVYVEDGSDDAYPFILCRWNPDGEVEHIGVDIFSDILQVLEFNYGDVDMSGSVNVIDANIIRRYSAKLLTLSDTALILSDVNGDGQVNVIDANLIRRYSAKLIDVFPIEVS
ncbi:MAG: InlB B-repeat-containing protein [Clostridia bacterium]|nr:InlB B-repeat-containing protein [Clostridia bacterium]